MPYGKKGQLGLLEVALLQDRAVETLTGTSVLLLVKFSMEQNHTILSTLTWVVLAMGLVLVSQTIAKPCARSCLAQAGRCRAEPSFCASCTPQVPLAGLCCVHKAAGDSFCLASCKPASGGPSPVEENQTKQKSTQFCLTG